MKKGIAVSMIKTILWLAILAYIFVVIYDYIRVKNAKEPYFCIKNEIIEEDNGNTYICTGLGYKYYDYRKDNYAVKKFVPFWVDPQSVTNN